VLVEVHAPAVNPLDVVNSAGRLGTPLPMIPGGDLAGIVVSASRVGYSSVYAFATSLLPTTKSLRAVGGSEAAGHARCRPRP
jgi:hypothetical protein